MFANRISSSTSCSIWLPETSPPGSARGLLRHRFQSCNTSRFADLFWPASKSCGTTHAGDIQAVNLKPLDFSPLSEFLLGTGFQSLKYLSNSENKKNTQRVF